MTSVAVTEDESAIFSASKDGTIIQCRKLSCDTSSWFDIFLNWKIIGDSETGKRITTFPSKRKGGVGHQGPILAVACSSDGTYLASGGMSQKRRGP